MTNLTEQWKKGKLPHGWYYIKIADIVFIDFFEGKVWKNKKDEYIDKILAEVPSYDEYQALLSDQLAKNEGAEINAELKEENAQLKELLKKARGLMNYTKDWACSYATEDLLTKNQPSIRRRTMVSRTAEQIVMEMNIPQLKKAIELQKRNMAIQEISDNFYYINGRRAMDEMVLHTYEKELKIKEAMEKENEKKNNTPE